MDRETRFGAVSFVLFFVCFGVTASVSGSCFPCVRAFERSVTSSIKRPVVVVVSYSRRLPSPAVATPINHPPPAPKESRHEAVRSHYRPGAGGARIRRRGPQLPGAVRRAGVPAPGPLRPVLPLHERHAHARDVRERAAVRRQGRGAQPLQLQLGGRVRQPEVRHRPDAAVDARLRVPVRRLPGRGRVLHQLPQVRVRRGAPGAVRGGPGLRPPHPRLQLAGPAARLLQPGGGRRLQVPAVGAVRHGRRPVLAVPALPGARRLPPADHLRRRTPATHHVRRGQGVQRGVAHLRKPGGRPACLPPLGAPTHAHLQFKK